MAVLVAAALGMVAPTFAAPADDPAPSPAPSATEAPGAPAEAATNLVTLHFPEDVDLKILIDYVGTRLGVNFLYDEQVGTQRVTLKAPKAIPTDSLMTLLDSALRMKGLVMVATDIDGMMRIEAAKSLTATAVGPDGAPPSRPTLAMTRVFPLRYASAQRAEEVLRPFLAATTANLTALPEHGLVIVTDYADNLPRLESLLTVIDRPKREVLVRFVPVGNLEAAPAAQRLTQLLAARAKARDGTAAEAAAGVTVLADERTNQIAIVGAAEEVDEAIAMLNSLDISLGLVTKIYTFTVASPEQVDRLVKEWIGDLTAKRFYRSAVDRSANLLIVTATPDIHEQIETLRTMLDKPVAEAQNPIRFYKLKNAKAIDVLATLQGIEGDSGLTDVSVDGVAADKKTSEPPALVLQGPTEVQANQPAAVGGTAAEGPARSNKSIGVHGARIMADEPSNTLIIIAEPSVQTVYERLIERLDIRRPQVLIEAVIFTLDTTDGFSLGVDLSNADHVAHGKGNVLTFSSFGLSEADTTTGELTLTPGTGFNGAVLGADIANAVIRALESDSRAKVVSRPSVLINDNATGTLVSENEEPFASVNASSTVATTSFAGYTAAGTKIKITPQISEGDYLKVKYEVTLSSFSNTGTDTLPPARHTNSLASEATIPDGYTIVVGGLTRENLTESVDRIPLLGSVPGLEYFFSNRSKSAQQTTLFVFLRAVVLREDKFEDLKVLSRDAARQVELPDDFPSSEPVEVR